MSFPNVSVAPGATTRLDLLTYFDDPSSVSVKVDDTSIATAALSSNKLTISGLAEGQTSATITGDGKNFRFVVSVRKNISNGGWL